MGEALGAIVKGLGLVAAGTFVVFIKVFGAATVEGLPSAEEFGDDDDDTTYSSEEDD